MGWPARVSAREPYDIEALEHKTRYVDLGMSSEFDGNLGGFSPGGLTVPGAASLTVAPSAPLYDLTTRVGALLLQPKEGIGNEAQVYRALTLADGEELVVAMDAPFAQGAQAANDIHYGVAFNSSDVDYSTGTRDYFMWDGGNGTLSSYNGSAITSLLGTSYLPGGYLYWRFIRVSNLLHAYFSSNGSTWAALGNIDLVARGHNRVWIFYRAQLLTGSKYSAPMEIRWFRHITSNATPYPF